MGVQNIISQTIVSQTITGQVSAVFGASMLVPDVRIDRLGDESAPEVTVFISAPVAVTVNEVAALVYELSLGDADGLAEIEPDEALRMTVELLVGNGWCEVEAIRERVAAGLVSAPGEALAYWQACVELAHSALAPVLPGPGPTPRPRKASRAAARDASRTAAADASLMVGAGCNSAGQR
jgi:hypothetical protein